MILKILPSFLPIYHLASDISTRPQQVSPVQMSGGQVSA